MELCANLTCLLNLYPTQLINDPCLLDILKAQQPVNGIVQLGWFSGYNQSKVGQGSWTARILHSCVASSVGKNNKLNKRVPEENSDRHLLLHCYLYRMIFLKTAAISKNQGILVIFLNV